MSETPYMAQMMRDQLRDIQEELFDSSVRTEAELRELIGGARFCMKVIRQYDPEYKIRNEFLEQQFQVAEPVVEEEPKAPAYIPEDLRAMRGLPGDRPDSF